MDEKGFPIGVTKKARRVVNISLFQQGKLKGAGQDGNRSWITFIASICCDGTYLPAGIIFKGAGGLQDQWVVDFNTDKEVAYFASSPSGYTNEDLTFQWLTTTFDRATRKKASNGNRWRLLWLDGHNSHINMRFLDWCNENRVFVAMYPSHSTHRLQPLDVSCFSPLAIRYTQHLDQWIAKHGGIISLNQSDFYNLFKLSLIEAFTEKNILSGWRKTGLYPLNPSIVLKQLKPPPPPQLEPSSSSLQPLERQPDWRKMRRELIKAHGDNPLNQVILKGFETLSAENALLKAEIEGMRETIKLQKRKAIKSKNLFQELADESGNKAIWFSPAKIARARELKQQKEDEEQQEKRDKEEKAAQKKQAKQDKENEAQIRREQREEAKLERERLKALKQAATKAVKTQREVDKQLKLEAQKANRNKKKKTSQSEARKQLELVIVDELEAESAKTGQTRSGRKTKAPQRFEE